MQLARKGGKVSQRNVTVHNHGRRTDAGEVLRRKDSKTQEEKGEERGEEKLR